MTMGKQYKAGQIVTISGKLYRLKNIKKRRFSFNCYDCVYKYSYTKEPCASCMIKLRIPFNLYPMRILPKSSLG